MRMNQMQTLLILMPFLIGYWELCEFSAEFDNKNSIVGILISAIDDWVTVIYEEMKFHFKWKFILSTFVSICLCFYHM